MSIFDDLAGYVDQRIARAAPHNIHMGTVQSKWDGSIFTTVTFDGSNISVPVKTFQFVTTGDRVGMVKFGSDWVVVGAFDVDFPQMVGNSAFATVGSTSSTTFVDFPGPIDVVLTKKYDFTNVFVHIDVSHFIDPNQDIGCVFGVAVIDPVPAVAADYTTHKLHVKPVLTHSGSSGLAGIAASVMPAGVYTLRMRWRKSAGGPAGNCHVDTNDHVSMWVLETAGGI